MSANLNSTLSGQQALRQQVGDRFNADWKSNDHRARRLVAEFIGTSGLTFVLSGGAAILAGYGGATLAPYQFAFILSACAALWLVAAVFFLGDISSHFNPAMTLAFAMRGDMGNLAATVPAAGMIYQSVAFEAILTFGMVLLVLSMTNGPKLDSSSAPLAVGAYVMAMGTMGGPFDGAAFNPARAFGPDFARWDFSTYWVYALGSLIGVLVAVVIARFLRGPAKASEANAAMGNPLDS